MKPVVTQIRWLASLLVVVAMAGPSWAQPRELDGTPLDRSTYATFQGNFRKYARYAFEVNGGYGVIPNYRQSIDSSLGMTVNEVLDEHSQEREVRSGSLVRKVRRTPPREDAMAYARALQDTKVGSYGYVASVKILHIINDNEMIVSEIWLIDRDKLKEEYEREEERNAKRNDGKVDRDELNYQYVSRIKLRKLQDSRASGMTGVFRLVGYNTRGLRPGQRWKGTRGDGFQVGVVYWEKPERDEFKELDRNTQRKVSGRERLVLSELTKTLEKGLNEEDFKKLLLDRKMSVKVFTEVVHRIRKEQPRESDKLIFDVLLPPDKDD